MSEVLVPGGGEFLICETTQEKVFTPEMLTAETRLIARSMEEFMRREVVPLIPRLEAQEPGLLASLLRQAGELGLLAGGVPERYGGLELPKTTLLLLAEKAAVYLSFAISLGVHTGVATLPLLFFGTEEQKRRYLPNLASGATIGAFALSEAHSGSDAFAARAGAMLLPGNTGYRLTGEKMWITNGGFADLFTLFASVENEHFTAFLIDKDAGGMTLGREESKIGLHGSSTRRLLLQEAHVPAESVLGEVGKGHRPALYALNIGRFNIGATALGAARECLRMAVRYAIERVQFGRAIATFDLIRHKLAEMAIRIYVLESMLYRIAGYWDALATETSQNGSASSAESFMLASEEYAIECAIVKFFGTEVLNYAADEAVQIHGGYGYSEEFPIARMYRDARVFRIFEGTNEINRLTVLDQLLRRVASGRLNLSVHRNARRARVHADVDAETNADAAVSLAEISDQIELMRETIKCLLQTGREMYGDQIGKNQLFAVAIADLAATLFALESAWLRASQPDQNRAKAEPGAAITLFFAAEAGIQTERLVHSALASLQTGDHSAIGRCLAQLRPDPGRRNTHELRQHIADWTVGRA